MSFESFDPTLVMDCFNIFVGCISISNHKVVAMQGLEQLAALSVKCFFQTLRHLSATSPTSRVLKDLRRRYNRILPFSTDFWGLPFYYTIINTHALATPGWTPDFEEWTSYRPSDQELVLFARDMVNAAQVEYQQIQNKQVPSWILSFALHFLSQDPPSPASTIADCLTIIAIALNHDTSGAPISDERYIYSLLWVPTVLTTV